MAHFITQSPILLPIFPKKGSNYSLAIALILFIIGFLGTPLTSMGQAACSSCSTIPDKNTPGFSWLSGCDDPATFTHTRTLTQNTTTWDDLSTGFLGFKPSEFDKSKRVKITGSGQNVLRIPNSNLIIDGDDRSANQYPYLVLEDLILEIENGEFQMIKGARVIIRNCTIRVSGNIQQQSAALHGQPASWLCITGGYVESGDEAADGTFQPGNNYTSSNWQNDNGKRYLNQVCFNVTQNFQQTTNTYTEDLHVSVCAEIGDQGPQHTGSDPFDGIDNGSGESGNMDIRDKFTTYNSIYHITSGNFSFGSDSDSKICDGHFKTNDGYWDLDGGDMTGCEMCVWARDEDGPGGQFIEQSGSTYTIPDNTVTWRATNATNSELPGNLTTSTQASLTDIQACMPTCCIGIYPPPVTNAGNGEVCLGFTTTVDGDPSGGTGSYTHSWTNLGTGTALNISLANTSSQVVTVDASGATATPGFVNLCYTVTDAVGHSAAANVVVVIHPRATVNAGSNSPVCLGQTINLTAAGTGTPTINYSWSGPGGYSTSTQNPNIHNAAFTDAGTYTVVVTDANGCSAHSRTQVIVNPLPTVTTNNPTVCEGQTINLTASGTGAASLSYSWSGPGGFTSSAQNPSISNAVLTDAGSYTVTITDGNGCTSQATATVTVNPLPTVTTNDPTVCVGQTINLTASGSGTPTLSYSWTGPGAFASSAQNPSISNATLSDGGNYTVTITDGNSCSAQDVATVTVNPLPTVTANDPTVCVGQTINLTASGSGAPTLSYSWSGPGGFTSNSQNLSIPNAALSDGGNYTVTITDGNSCSAQDVATVTVNPLPTVTTNDPTICSGQSINLTATGSGRRPFTYSWSGPGGFTSGNATPSIAQGAMSDAGSYTVTVTDANGCSAQSIASVTVNPLPRVNPADPTVCVGQSIFLDANGLGNPVLTFSWTGPGGFTASIEKPIINNATVGNAGVYTVTVTDGNSCSAQGTANVTVNSPPNISVNKNDEQTCQGNDGSFTVGNLTSGALYTLSYRYNSGAAIVATITATLAGDYTVGNLAPGSYSDIKVTGANGCPSPPQGITINPGPCASLGDKVWEDLDEDGVQDSNEPGVPGVRVTLYNCLGGSISSLLTDANGMYTFGNLNPGSYYVIFSNLPTGYVFSPKDNATFDNEDSDVDPITGATICTTLDPGENDPTWDAGIYLPKASLGDCVWYDENENGIQDPTETGVAGVTVSLYDGAGNLITSKTTNILGKYLFDKLVPGDYSVKFSNLPLGWVFTQQDAGSNDGADSDADPSNGCTITTTLSPGENDLTWDAGIYILRASLGDCVWDDSDEDGVKDPNEPGVSNVDILLYDCSGTLKGVTSTNALGLYKFENLIPGSYYVLFDLPANYVFSPKDNAGNDAIDSDADELTGRTICTTLSPGENDLTWDAGIYIPKAKLGDFVFEDTDNDGQQDPGESGVANVRVVLYNCVGDSLDQTFTNSLGKYCFPNLIPGGYYVTFKDLPTGYGFSPKDQGNDITDSDADQNGQTPCTTLIPNENDTTVDAGVIPPTGQLGDYVWEDINEDGEQDPGEPGVPGIRVVLYNCNGDSLDQTFTDANGLYLFTNLPGGNYYVGFFDIPPDYEFTIPNQVADTDDSDANPTTGLTACVTLPPGGENKTPDAGITPKKDRVCVADEFAPGAFGMLFTSGLYPGTDPNYVYDSNGCEFISYMNGTARLTGIVVNKSNSNMKFFVELRLIDKRDWGQWTALGRSVKGSGNGPFMSWYYYEVDSLRSSLVGKGSLAGDTIGLSHAPVNRYYGFQVGDGANDKNANYGLGGWFNWVDKSTGITGSGDFNNNLINCIDSNAPSTTPQLGAVAILEGAYDSSTELMRTDLQAQSLSPPSQPFNTAPWNYNGTEVMAATAPDTVVDWALIELRDVNNPETILSKQAGLLLRGGQIVQPDGHSLLEFPPNISSAYIVIHNWNHLPVMSAQPLQKHGNLYFHDFTDGSNSVYTDPRIPNSPARTLPGGITVLYQGDATGDAQINSLDLGKVLLEYFNTGSTTTDINLDGVTNSLDVAKAMGNYFIISHIPE